MTAHYGNKQSGLARSAGLLRALGANAAQVWNELDPADAAALSEAMNASSDTVGDEAAAQDYVTEMRQRDTVDPVWAQLSALKPDALARLLEDEHPQLIAFTLSRIAAKPASAFVRRLPPLLATDVLHRMLHITTPLPGALAAIEENFENRLRGSDIRAASQSDDTVARIIEALPDDKSETLLTALQAIEPGADERIKALMFGFADLANFTPAGMQTLLANANRATLVLALKGESGEVGQTVYNNMTARAREALQEDIAALGAQRRKDVEAARSELVSLARKLVEAGDILPAGTDLDEDLIA